jgi:hypothetical protein
MSDEEGDSEGEAAEPVVELGEGADVEGAPVVRVAHRLNWGIERSEIREREGDTVIRTPEGPRELGDVLDAVEVPYFQSRQEFLRTGRAETGRGPVNRPAN